MNKFKIILTILFFIGLGYVIATAPKPQNREAIPRSGSVIEVIPITHATMILKWGDVYIYSDPTGGAQIFETQPKANLVLVTDVHGDHLNVDTLNVVASTAFLIVPQAVFDQLPENLKATAKVINNGETINEQGFNITAIPMYNLPEASDARHIKGRGNGYVIEKDGQRVYIAGDTDGISEMRSLTDIDIAFVPMNPPFTMDIEEAADAVLSFKPKQIYPYHYRGQGGLSDVNKFKELVNAGNQDIEVVLLNWYPEQE